MSEKNANMHDGPLTPASVAAASLLSDLQQLIRSARERAAAAVNAELTMLYWRIGERLRKGILHEQRAEYGRQIVEAVAAELLVQFGKGFERTEPLSYDPLCRAVPR